jgi:hypothetical protein
MMSVPNTFINQERQFYSDDERDCIYRLALADRGDNSHILQSHL